MTSNPPSPATSDLRMAQTPEELEELMNRTRLVMEDEGNYISLIMADTIELSWPSVLKMQRELEDLPTVALRELISRYEGETSATALWTAIVASRSYKSVSTLLEERTALLQSCRSPDEYMLTLETPGLPGETLQEARKLSSWKLTTTWAP